MSDKPDAAQAFDLGALGHKINEQTEGSAERQAHIERLRKLVQSGEYHVDSEALARKLIESHLADEEK